MRMDFDLGKWLRDTREDLDLTQKKVMELTGIHHKTLSGYERNFSEPDLQTLATLCRLYHVSLDDFLKIKKCEMTEAVQPGEQRLLNTWRQLPLADREDALYLLEKLADRRGKKS